MNNLILNSDGSIRVIDFRCTDTDEVRFNAIVAVFETSHGEDNYECQSILKFTAEDVANAIEMVGNGNGVFSEFALSLGGHGFEIFGCWHENGKSLAGAGVYDENLYLSRNGFHSQIYGPVVLFAQINDGGAEQPVEVSASVALELAKVINEESLFGGN